MVSVRLELPPNREARVFVGRYRDRGYKCSNYAGGSCGLRAETRCVPIDPLVVQSLLAHEYEEIGNFWVNDTITIEIHDKLLEKYGGGPYQHQVYTATMDGFVVQTLACTLHNRQWPQITFEEINVVNGGVYVPRAPVMPPALVMPFAEAVKKLQERNFGYITNGEIAAITRQFQDDKGDVDFDVATKAVCDGNKLAKTAAKSAGRDKEVRKSVQVANNKATTGVKTQQNKETTTSEPLAIRQARDIIQTHT